MRFGVLGLLCWPNGYKACILEGQNSDFEDSCIVLKHFRVPNGVSNGGGSKGGKPSGGCIGPRARRLFSYIGVLARGWAAYVGYVAPQRVAMSAV